MPKQLKPPRLQIPGRKRLAGQRADNPIAALNLHPAPHIVAPLDRRREGALLDGATEQFAHATIDALTAHICVLDEHGTILAVNEAWRRFGLDNPPVPQGCFLGENYLSACDRASGPNSNEAAPFATGLRGVLGGKIAEFSLEYPCHAPRNQRWFMGRATRCVGAGPARVVVAHENITARKQAEDALRFSEERFRTLVEHASDAIYVRTDGCFAYVNPAALRLFGANSPEELLGQAVVERLHPDLRARVCDRMRLLNEVKQAVPVVEEVYLRLDGTPVPAEVSAAPIDYNGKSAAVVYARDITSRKRAEEALRQREEYFRALIENALDVITVINRDGKIRYESPSVERVLGYHPDELLGRNCFDLVHPEDAPRIQAILLDGIERPLSTAREDFRIRHKDGSWRHLEGSGRNLVSDPNVQGVVINSRDITERKRVESIIQRNEAELEAIYDSTPIMMCLLNQELEVERINRSMAHFIGLPVTELSLQGQGDLLGCINALDHPEGCGHGPRCQSCTLRLALTDTFLTGQPRRQVECPMFLVRAGVRREIRVSASTALLRARGKAKVVLCLEDVTARKELESQYLQAQKMEAIGQLAGGVAHDFNNVLAASLLQLQLLQTEPGLGLETLNALKELEKGTQRAAGLTRQLLLFSRRQAMQTKRLDLNQIVAELSKMLKRLLGEDITMTFTLAPEPMWLDADAGMVEQVVMNLCVNARDAMPKGGQITVTTQGIEISPEDSQRHPDAYAGSFVRLSVADSGTGMDEATMNRLFEPFFTTKDPGKGTGLGLATVYGITRQHHGWVEVSSELGRGSAFNIFLPAAGPVEVSPSQAPAVQALGGTETILLVEDDESFRRMACMTLRRHGYRIFEASNGVEALRQWGECAGAASMLITDMIMPGGVTGLDLAEQFRQFKPALKVIISTGYSPDLVDLGKHTPPGIHLLLKPYKREVLLSLVRECLDAKT
jgi:two-component system cell cycle sensor histidine kinase/response regulator CckA